MATLDTRGRATSEQTWPNGGMVTRRLGDRNYDVQQFTGYSVSTVPAGGWVRGQMVRVNQPTMQPPDPVPMLDPTSTEQYGTLSYLYKTRSGR